MPPPLALSVDFGQGFTDAWTAVATFVPKLIAFLVILLIGWFLAKLTARVADRLLRRVGFERLAERSGVAHALRGPQYDATGILAKILYYGILLIALQLGFGVFGPNPVSSMINGVVAWLPKAIVACVIVVVAMAIARAVRDIVRGALGETPYGRGLSTVAWACIVALGVIAALGQAEIATSVTGPVLTAALATIAGILIVGVGGGLIHPMRRRWERWLSIAEQESARVREKAEPGPTTPRRKPPGGPTAPGEGPDFIDPM
ncbi:mechanosensitive ion channel family protein [Streptomyces sp. CA-135486]|uniref:mechanosensitive ion channel family protein n=1 Tax=Streptomyces sp. CA-135486 TaxID=3240049 RepID=UPI003D8B94C2